MSFDDLHVGGAALTGVSGSDKVSKKCDLCKGNVFRHYVIDTDKCDECNAGITSATLVVFARGFDPRWATIKAAQGPEEKNENKLKPACDWCGECSECAKVLRCECRRLCCDVVGGTCGWQMARYKADETKPDDDSGGEHHEVDIVPPDSRNNGTGDAKMQQRKVVKATYIIEQTFKIPAGINLEADGITYDVK